MLPVLITVRIVFQVGLVKEVNLIEKLPVPVQFPLYLRFSKKTSRLIIRNATILILQYAAGH
jgi:hypothetical protein